MVWPWVAYQRRRSAAVAWEGHRLQAEIGRDRFALPPGDDPLLVWDMRGVLKNRPDPAPLPLNPSRETFVDSGGVYGEDVVDCLMADRGTVVLPLRALRGFEELTVALDYSDELVIGLDWAGDVVARHADFRGGLDRLLPRLSQAGVRRLLVACLDDSLPFLPAGVCKGFQVYLAQLTGAAPPPAGVAGVFGAV